MYKVGDKIPVWWNTGIKNEGGENIATVLEVRDYQGPYEYFDSILKLTAAFPSKRGWLEMTV
jgi:hypothetical protein